MKLPQRLQTARQAYDAGDSFTAAQHWWEASKMVPDDLGILRDAAFAFADFDRQAASDVMQGYIDRHATNPRQLVQALEIQLPYAESVERAKRGLSIYSAEDGLNGELGCDEPVFRYVGPKLEVWVRAVDEIGVALPLSFKSFVRGDLPACERYLDLAGRGQIDPRFAAAHFAPSSGSPSGDGIGGTDGEPNWFDGIETWLAPFIGKLPQVRWKPNPKSNPKSTRRVFIGCDQAFFDKYGIGLQRSFERSGTKADLHIHIYDGGPGWGFADSAEKTILAGQPTAKFYYAAIRLIRFYELMLRDPCPTIMLDADLFVGKPLDGLFDRLEATDVALCRMPGRMQFHAQFNASCFGVNPTAAGMAYLKRVAAYIAKGFGTIVPWCFDQLSLLCTLREMQSCGVGPRTIAVGPGVYDGTYNAALWAQKVGQHHPEYLLWKQANAKFGG